MDLSNRSLYYATLTSRDCHHIGFPKWLPQLHFALPKDEPKPFNLAYLQDLCNEPSSPDLHNWPAPQFSKMRSSPQFQTRNTSLSVYEIRSQLHKILSVDEEEIGFDDWDFVLTLQWHDGHERKGKCMAPKAILSPYSQTQFNCLKILSTY